MSVQTKNKKELRETLAFVLLLAPDRFQPEDKLDLNTGFIEINDGIENCRDEIGGLEEVARLKAMAALSLEGYRSGDTKLGSKLLQEIRNSLAN
jgi:hypothetical protein